MKLALKDTQLMRTQNSVAARCERKISSEIKEKAGTEEQSERANGVGSDVVDSGFTNESAERRERN